MANLIPPKAEKKMRAEYRVRALLVASLALLLCGALSILALAPAEVALVSFSPPAAPSSAPQSGNIAADRSALAQTKALLSVMAPFATTTSLDAITGALSQLGQGITIDAISYSIVGETLSLTGEASSPDAANALRESLQSDPEFSNVSIPVSALLGSQNGNFTISMDITQ